MKSFTHLSDFEPVTRTNEHGGEREIHFRRLWSALDFNSPVDFVDFTVIPPGSTIGWHSHQGNEEMYFIALGTPLVRVEDDLRRLSRGDIALVRSGESHELINDTSSDVEILVFQTALSQRSSS